MADIDLSFVSLETYGRNYKCVFSGRSVESVFSFFIRGASEVGVLQIDGCKIHRTLVC